MSFVYMSAEGQMLVISFTIERIVFGYILTMNNHNTVWSEETFALIVSVTVLDAKFALQTTVIFNRATSIESMCVRAIFSKETSAIAATARALLGLDATTWASTLPFWP